MTVRLGSCAIAVLASIFIAAPLPHRPAAATTPPVLAIGPIARPSFPAPELRVLDLTIAEPMIAFDGTIGPVVVAEDQTSFASPAIRPPAQLSPYSAEEFPGAVAVSVPQL